MIRQQLDSSTTPAQDTHWTASGQSPPVDLSDFEAAVLPLGGKCQIRTIDLSPTQRDQLNAAMANGFGSATISRTLGKWGFSVKSDTVARHRHGQCSCKAPS